MFLAGWLEETAPQKGVSVTGLPGSLFATTGDYSIRKGCDLLQ